jgi:hypothetical protein
LQLTLETGRPYFTVQMRSIEATGSGPWTLRGYYHYTPWRDDEAHAVDVFGADVPNYWLPVGAWLHRGRGLMYGSVIATDSEPASVLFYKDETGLHSDCLRDLSIAMGPGTRWSAPGDEPIIAVFGAAPTADDPKPFLRWLNIPKG